MPQFSEELDDHPLEGKKILVAEDDERLRTIVAMMIEELGAEVISVEDGKSALDVYQQDPKEIDLVLLDMRMKGLSGAATSKRLLEFDPDVKVVLSSGVMPDDDIVDMLVEHGGGFVEKPFNLNRLSEIIGKVLNGEPTILKL
ncbi:MAG: response regulator [Proteobacteria bacterium]|nr:response regulator [Pseudomonadota bacterium]